MLFPVTTRPKLRVYLRYVWDSYHVQPVKGISYIPYKLVRMPNGLFIFNSADTYLFKLRNTTIRTISEICSKLILETIEQRQWRRSDIFSVNFEQISHIADVSFVYFEQVNSGWKYGKDVVLKMGKYLFRIYENFSSFLKWSITL